jgi:hypothetical protein
MLYPRRVRLLVFFFWRVYLSWILGGKTALHCRGVLVGIGTVRITTSALGSPDSDQF